MKTEIFNTQIEFNTKFPSKLYVCAFCAKLTPYKDFCIHCQTRADGFLKTMNSGYKYAIKENSLNEKEIFKPIEMEMYNNATKCS